MVLRGFERRLENLVEGVFARVFRSGLRPIELGRRLVREMDVNRSVDVKGRTMVPNSFTILLSPSDAERFAEIADSLERELCDAAREHAHDENYSFPGPVSVELLEHDRLRTGEFRIEARLRQGEGGVGAGSLLLPGGERHILDDRVATIGRLPDCEVTVSDTNVSRRHAEIRPHGDGFVVVDLGSTNGTKVNGVRVTERTLRDGDELTFGNTRITFEAS
ncbi:MAG: DUF3662 and FHA domain-containing protein [Acidimicrobiia bacterium]|nr:DUF3662 and FHA domain-containing protein [Acidimicrobiia bacterium]